MMCYPFGVNVDVAPLRGTVLFVVLYIPGDAPSKAGQVTGL